MSAAASRGPDFAGAGWGKTEPHAARGVAINTMRCTFDVHRFRAVALIRLFSFQLPLAWLVRVLVFMDPARLALHREHERRGFTDPAPQRRGQNATWKKIGEHA